MKFQFFIFTVLVLLTGIYLGVFRVAYPLQSTYSLFIYLSLIVFGFVKGSLNLLSGLISDKYGRKAALISGWLVALPLPLISFITFSNELITILTSLIALNQAFTWTTTVTSQIDIAGKRRSGLAVGINEASGYGGVTLGGLIAGLAIYKSLSPYIFMLLVSLVALFFSSAIAVETSKLILKKRFTSSSSLLLPILIGIPGLLEKFVDSFYWATAPLYLKSLWLRPLDIALVISTYTFTWTFTQPIFGFLSDLVNRKSVILLGFASMALGVILFPYNFYIASLINGLGMGMVYPTLIALVNDVVNEAIRGKALGIYRLLRDFGYGVSGVVLIFISFSLIEVTLLIALLQLIAFLIILVIRIKVVE